MRFQGPRHGFLSRLLTICAVLSFAGPSVCAHFTNANYHIVRGEPFTLTWDESTPVNISLLNADNPTATVEILLVATLAAGGALTWTPPSNLPDTTYVFQIVGSSGSANFSPQWQFEQAPPATSIPPPASTTTLAASSSTAVVNSPVPFTDIGNSSGLSNGVKAGIGVGTTVGVLFLFGMCGYFFYRTGKRAGQRANNDQDSAREKGTVASQPESEEDPKLTPKLEKTELGFPGEREVVADNLLRDERRYLTDLNGDNRKYRMPPNF